MRYCRATVRGLDASQGPGILTAMKDFVIHRLVSPRIRRFGREIAFACVITLIAVLAVLYVREPIELTAVQVPPAEHQRVAQ